MTKDSGLGSRFYAGGIDISGDITAVGRIGGGPALLECTGLDKSAFERIGGVRSGNMEVTSFWNPVISGTSEHTVWSALPTADVITSYVQRLAVGGAVASCIGKQLNYDGTRANDGALTLVTTVESSGFGIDWGFLLTAGAASQGAAGNLASNDDGAGGSTLFGLQAYVQLLAFTGTSITFNIQSSTDNAVGDPFATITGASSTAMTAIGAQRFATGPTATVERYLRVNTTGTFSAATFLVAVSRNFTTVTF